MRELFKFPIVMIDGDNEERKSASNRLMGMGIGEEGVPDEYDIIYGEAEYPYWDFIGIEDRWIPSKASAENAMNGKFDACFVKFANVGHILVAWPRKKFKAELKKFIEEYEKEEKEKKEKETENREIRVINLTAEELSNLMNKTNQ